MDKLVKFLDCYIPTETCNFRCHYCYITQQRKFNNAVAKFQHSPAEIRKALSKERLGGTCLLNFCAGGETLISKDVLPVIKELLTEGHYLMVVTNGTLTNRFKEIAKWDKNILKRLFFKFSFHYLELIRINAMEVFFENIRLMASIGCSFTVEITPNDELIEHIDKIKAVCKRELGTLCHITIARNDTTENIDVLSKHSFEDFKKIWGVFDSDLFDYKKEIFYQKRTEFCYAGYWSAYLNLVTGDMKQCYCGDYLDNIYKNIDKPLYFNPVGYNCTLPHCYNGHAFLALGVIPELKSPAYSELRNRECEDGTQWLQPEMKAFMSQKLSDNNKKLGVAFNIKQKLSSLRRILRRKVSSFKVYYYYLKRFRKRLRQKRMVIFLAPNHTNIGDSAILYAQKQFVEKSFPGKFKIIEVENGEFLNYKKVISKMVGKKDIITTLGGGNMGDEWFFDEKTRREVIKAFPNNKLIHFPQTIHYTDSEKGKIEEKNSIKIYNGHQNQTIIAREEASFEKMKQLYNSRILLTPDMVLWLENITFEQKREGVLFCMRNDVEKLISNTDIESLEKFLNNSGLDCVFSDTHSKENISEGIRDKVVLDKMKEIAKSRLVITDRLHGMVFAAVTGTPCIVFENYNHKVRGTYNWISYLPYIRLARDFEEAKIAFAEMDIQREYKYDKSRIDNIFNQIIDVIRE